MSSDIYIERLDNHPSFSDAFRKLPDHEQRDFAKLFVEHQYYKAKSDEYLRAAVARKELFEETEKSEELAYKRHQDIHERQQVLMDKMQAYISELEEKFSASMAMIERHQDKVAVILKENEKLQAENNLLRANWN